MKLKEERDKLEKEMVSFGNDYDRKIVRSIPNIYGKHLPSLKNKVVLDIGGQIGGFAVYAASKGAKRVVTVEPLKRNVKHLKLNCKKYPQIKVLYGAVVGRKSGGDRFITSGAIRSKRADANFGHNVLRREPSSRIASFQVESLYRIATLLKDKPDIIKIDCEGSEHEIFRKIELPICVQAVAMEIHFYSQAHRVSWKRIKSYMHLIGFQITSGKPSTIEGKGAFGTVVFQR